MEVFSVSGAYDAVISGGAFVSNHIPSTCFEDLIRITNPGRPILKFARLFMFHYTDKCSVKTG